MPGAAARGRSRAAQAGGTGARGRPAVPFADQSGRRAAKPSSLPGQRRVALHAPPPPVRRRPACRPGRPPRSQPPARAARSPRLSARSARRPRPRRAALRAARLSQKTGGVLLSQALAGQVPSALRGLTALFGMGRGVSPSPRPPENGERRLPRSFKTAQRHSGHQNIRQALDPLVPVSFGRYRPSRSGLSTWWSTRGLTPSRGWEN
jgi:hypothetical protein